MKKIGIFTDDFYPIIGGQGRHIMDLYESTYKKNPQFIIFSPNKNNLKGKLLIGIHPGSGPLTYKKAPDKEFLNKINLINNKKKFILIFGGPEEKEIKERFNKIIKNSLIINTNIKNTAALIKNCNYFITNDTGLMHIAAAMKVPKVITFFNGTNPTRTRPYSKNANVIILKENRLKYPFHSTIAR